MSEDQKLQDQITLGICGGCGYLNDNLECIHPNPENFPSCYESSRASSESMPKES